MNEPGAAVYPHDRSPSRCDHYAAWHGRWFSRSAHRKSRRWWMRRGRHPAARSGPASLARNPGRNPLSRAFLQWRRKGGRRKKADYLSNQFKPRPRNTHPRCTLIFISNLSGATIWSRSASLDFTLSGIGINERGGGKNIREFLENIFFLSSNQSIAY